MSTPFKSTTRWAVRQIHSVFQVNKRYRIHSPSRYCHYVIIQTLQLTFIPFKEYLHPTAKVYGTWAVLQVRISALLLHDTSNLVGNCIGGSNYYCYWGILLEIMVPRKSGNVHFYKNLTSRNVLLLGVHFKATCLVNFPVHLNSWQHCSRELIRG